MNIVKLAFQNFKRSLSTYLSLILSLAFTILVVFNFQNIVYSNLFDGLGETNRNNIDMLINTVTVVILVFSFFFIWYATNVFLARRKREIGIYVFMGLTNQRIAQMYLLETLFIGLTALALGLAAGVLFAQLFQMILLALSDITVDLRLQFDKEAVLSTSCFYGILYGIFALKGYVNIVRSSVIELVTANRKNEYVGQNGFLLVCRAVLGLGVLLTGYYYAVKEGGQEVIEYVLLATVLVIIGVYLLFGGFLPLVFQFLAKNKNYLYKGQRTLWINSMVFRMKKNYRTYAMTCVLMTCSVTALAAGFAMKQRYDNMINFRRVYSFQFLSDLPEQEWLEAQLAGRIEKDNDIAYQARVDILTLDADSEAVGLVRYSQIAALAEKVGLEPLVREPGEDDVIELDRVILLSLLTKKVEKKVDIVGEAFREIQESTVPYLGYLQEIAPFYVVNDAVYDRLLPLGIPMGVYNYGIADVYRYGESLDELEEFQAEFSERYGEEYGLGRVAIDPHDSESDWIRVMYSLCIFLFLVFILASGSILFMKLYNDAFEEKERMGILKKLGCGAKTLRLSVAKELACAYMLPFLVMGVSAYFSVLALEKMMKDSDLMPVYGVSTGVVLGFFLVFYLLSVFFYRRNAGTGQ